MQRMNFTDNGILRTFGDDQHRFRLIAHFCTDMPAHIVVTFVQVQHTMDMQVVFRRPLHHLIDDLHRFAGAVDVKHQVSDAVYDDQPIPLVLTQGIVDNPDTDGRSVFPQANEIEILVVCRGGQPCQAENAFQYVVAMETALFSVHVQDPTFAFGQVRPVVQDLPARQRRGDDGRDVERLFRFRLTRRSAEITERRYGGVVNPYNLGRSLVGVRGLYLRRREDIRQAVLVQLRPRVTVSSFFVFHSASG